MKKRYVEKLDADLSPLGFGILRLPMAEDVERIFQEQLKNLRVGYIDFYLMHGLDIHGWEYGKTIGLIDFLDEKRKSGQIRRTGNTGVYECYPRFCL